MPFATAERFLKPFDRQFQVITVDGDGYTIGRYTEQERREHMASLRKRLENEGRSPEFITSAINARFLQLVLWAGGREQRLLAVLDGTGRDTQFDGDARLNDVLNSDERHRAEVLNAVFEAYPDFLERAEKKGQPTS